MRQVIQEGRAVELVILAGPKTGASWRTSVRLAPGRYQFQGVARVAGFSPLAYGQSHGAFLRVWTKPPVRSPEIPERSKGSTRPEASQALAVEFTVASEQTVDLACEFRASAGEARFDESRLHLVQRVQIGNPE